MESEIQTFVSEYPMLVSGALVALAIMLGIVASLIIPPKPKTSGKTTTGSIYRNMQKQEGPLPPPFGQLVENIHRKHGRSGKRRKKQVTQQ